MEFTARRRRRIGVSPRCLRAGRRRLRLRRRRSATATRPGAERRLAADAAAARRASGWSSASPAPKPPGAVRRMVREGRVAGVILFAENFPSRAAGRRADRPAAGDPPPGRAARPAAGDGRPGGRPGEADRRRPDRLGRSRWAPAAPPSAAEQGARTAANLRDVGVNVDLAPVLDVARPGGDIAETERGFGSTPAAGSPPPRSPSPRPCRTAASRPRPSTSPASAAPALNTDFAVQRIGLSKSALRGVDEAPYRRFVAHGGEMVMLSTRDLPGLSPKPAAFSRRSPPASCASASASRASRSPTRSTASPSPPSAGRRRPGWRRPGPAPTCCSSPTTVRRPAPAAPWLRGLRSGRLSRAEFEASAGRVLRLRAGSGRAP